MMCTYTRGVFNDVHLHKRSEDLECGFGARPTAVGVRVALQKLPTTLFSPQLLPGPPLGPPRACGALSVRAQAPPSCAGAKCFKLVCTAGQSAERLAR